MKYDEITKPGNERPIKIRIAFDDDASAQSAEILVRHAASDVLCDTQSFAFKELETPGPSVAAARNAADTDIMVLAFREDICLPNYVQLWLGLWAGLRDEESGGALIVLITKGDGCANFDSPLMDYMEAIAAIGGLAFFSQPRALPDFPGASPSRRVRFAPVRSTADRFARARAVSRHDWGGENLDVSAW